MLKRLYCVCPQDDGVTHDFFIPIITYCYAENKRLEQRDAQLFYDTDAGKSGGEKRDGNDR